MVAAGVLEARLAGTAGTVRVMLTPHARERYIERLHPGADAATVTDEIARLFGMGVVEPRPASWDTTVRPALLYLTVGDVSFVLDVDRHRRDELVVVTCVVRSMRSRGRGSRTVRRRPQRVRRPAYRRPSPGSLALDLSMDRSILDEQRWAA